MEDQLIIHDRVTRSSTRLNNISIFRWNPIKKRLEVWSATSVCWRVVRATWGGKPWTLTHAIKYKWRTVKWIHTWAEPTWETE